MGFIQVANSSDPDIIGTKKGFYQVEIDQNLLVKHESYEEIERLFFTPLKGIDEFNEKVFELRSAPIQAKLIKRAVLTDLMGYVPYFFGCSLMISQKFFECIREFGVGDNEFSLIPVRIDGVDDLAYIFFVPLISIERINFKQSTFIDGLNQNIVKVNSYKEFIEFNDSGVHLDFHKVCLPKTYRNKTFLRLQGVSKLFFSEELVRFLSKESISSFEISKGQIELIFN